jgi:hypothetical protein
VGELAIQVEDRFAVRFDEGEADELALMTIGEFCEIVAARTSPTSPTSALSRRSTSHHTLVPRAAPRGRPR